MKNWIVYILTILLCTPTWGQAKTDLNKEYPLKMVGHLIQLKPNDKRNIYGFEYYLLTENPKTKKPLAYPVLFISKKMEEKKGSMVNKTVFFQAKVGSEVVTRGEKDHKVSVLKVLDGRVLTLSSLSPKSTSQDSPHLGTSDSGRARQDSLEQNYPLPENSLIHGSYRTYPGPTIQGVNDTLTNTLIFSGGAALLGTILLGK